MAPATFPGLHTVAGNPKSRRNGLPVTAIAANCFSSAQNITNVVIGDSVTYIGDSAFSDCQNLATFKMGNGVVTLGGGVFVNSHGLAAISLSTNLVSTQLGPFGTDRGPRAHAATLPRWDCLLQCNLLFEHACVACIHQLRIGWFWPRSPDLAAACCGCYGDVDSGISLGMR
jgi:hypothetical protein